MKVFSTKKYIKDVLKRSRGNANYIRKRLDKTGWFYDCDGLTKEEMNQRGYGTNDDWMIEKDVAS